MQEVSTEPWIDIPGPVLDIYRLWRPTPLFRATRLEQALQTPGAHLLQVRGRVAGRVAQAEHRRAAGVLQQGGRHPAHRHRDRRRASGARRWRWRASMFGLECTRVHGEGVVRAEAVPADLHGDVRRDGRSPRPVDRDEQRPRDPGGAPGLDRVARHRDQRGGGGRRHPRRHELLAGQRARTTSCCTRRSSGSRPSSRWRWPARRPTSIIGCVGGGSNYAGLAYPFMARQAARERSTRVPGRPSRRRARRSRRGGSPTTSATRRQMTPIVPMYTLGHDVRAGARARGRPALPRRRAVAVAAGARGPHGGGGVHAEPDLRGGGAVRADPGDHPGAGAEPRDQGRDRRGARGEARPARSA